MNRYEQWRANPSSVQSQAQHPPASNPTPQAQVPRRSIHSHGTNTPSSSSTRSSSRSRASLKPRSRTPSPYDQSPPDVDRVQRERVDASLRDMPRRHEQVYPADGARSDQLYAREDDANRRREWEEEGRRQIAEQRRQEQDGILRRQQEADHAAQAARLGHPTGQSQSVTAAPAVPLSASFSAPAPSIQYPSILGPSAPVSSGPTNAYMQMPLESPTRCVIFLLKHPWLRMFSRYLMLSNTGLFQTNLIKRETPLHF
jgi:STAM-binding protein